MPRGLWALNVPFLWQCTIAARAREMKVWTKVIGLSRRHRRLCLTVLTMVGYPSGCRWTSRCIPIWWARQAHAVCALVRGHDVSGTAWQTLGRAMQSTTTMMPVWQCGQSRNDCPVSASNRSVVVGRIGSVAGSASLRHELSTQVSQGGFAAPRLDGAGWQRLGDRPVVLENISLLHLPPYLPELNLVGMGIGAERVGVGYGAAVGGGATGPFQVVLP